MVYPVGYPVGGESYLHLGSPGLVGACRPGINFQDWRAFLSTRHRATGFNHRRDTLHPQSSPPLFPWTTGDIQKQRRMSGTLWSQEISGEEGGRVTVMTCISGELSLGCQSKTVRLTSASKRESSSRNLHVIPVPDLLVTDLSVITFTPTRGESKNAFQERLITD